MPEVGIGSGRTEHSKEKWPSNVLRHEQTLSSTSEGKRRVPGLPQTSEPLAFDQTLGLGRLWETSSDGNARWHDTCGSTAWQFPFRILSDAIIVGVTHCSPLRSHTRLGTFISPWRRWASKLPAAEWSAALGREEVSCLPVPKAAPAHLWGRPALHYLYVKRKMSVLIKLYEGTMWRHGGNSYEQESERGLQFIRENLQVHKRHLCWLALCDIH